MAEAHPLAEGLAVLFCAGQFAMIEVNAERPPVGPGGAAPSAPARRSRRCCIGCGSPSRTEAASSSGSLPRPAPRARTHFGDIDVEASRRATHRLAVRWARSLTGAQETGATGPEALGEVQAEAGSPMTLAAVSKSSITALSGAAASGSSRRADRSQLPPGADPAIAPGAP